MKFYTYNFELLLIFANFRNKAKELTGGKRTMVDFAGMIKKAQKGLKLLKRYHECIAWEDYSDRGNSCWKPYRFETSEDREQDALWHAAVKVALAKGSETHIRLSELAAGDLGNKYVTYDWLIKAVARVLKGENLNELHEMLILSKKVQAEMKAKGLDKIESLDQVLIG